jgi:hypothetical protein
MNAKLIRRILEIFELKLHTKTGWGRNDVLNVYKDSVREVLLEVIDENS